MNDHFGRVLVGIGLAIAAVGGLIMLSSRVRWLRLGRLPGDIAYERDGFSFYMPITTMLLLSALISLMIWIVGMLRR